MSFQSEFVQQQASMRTVVAHDVDEHAHNLTNWEQSYDQITSGRFFGALTECRTTQLQIFRESTSLAIRQSCRVWPDAFWFGIEARHTNTRINGRPNGVDTVMVRPGNCEFELMTPDNYEIFGVVIQRNALLTMAAQLGCRIDWSQLASAELLHVAESERLDCMRKIDALLAPNGKHHSFTGTIESDFRDHLAAAHHPNPRAMQQEAVLMALLAMLDTSEIESTATNSFIRRRRIVADARAFILAHRDALITVPLLCEKLFVSRRTLQYCFEGVLGISPIAYLRTVRLNGARRHLREGMSDKSVGEIAGAWGFGNFSQFSCDYKKLFGETPSASMKTGNHH